MQLLRGVGDAFASARLEYIAVALALHLAGLFVTGERWRVVTAALGGRVTLLRATIINLAGIFVRNVTPTTGLGGDASRVALLRAEGMALPEATASFAYVRAAEIPALAAVVLFALPALGAAIARSSRALLVGAVAIAAVAGVAWVARTRLGAALDRLRAWRARVAITRRAFGFAMAYAALAQVETLLRQMAVAAAFGFPLSLTQSATVTALSVAGGLVPTVGSVGAIDGGIVAALMISGAPADTAVAVTVAERAISYGLTTALGAGALAALGGRAMLRVAGDRKPDAVAG